MSDLFIPIQFKKEHFLLPSLVMQHIFLEAIGCNFLQILTSRLMILGSVLVADN